MGYKLEQVEAIASKLQALPAIEPPPKDLTKQEVVKMLAKEIKSLQKRGYTLEQIATSLKGEGLDISTPTLKSYLQKSKTTSKPKAIAQTKATVQKQVAGVAESTGAGSSESDGNTTSAAAKVDERQVDERAESVQETKKTSYTNKNKLVPKPDTPDL